MASTAETPCWLNESLPPPVVDRYTPTGRWEQIQGLKTYISGPQTAKKAVVVVYDAFGASSQVLQGSDRIAGHMDALVVMPDFFGENTISHDDFVKDRAGFRSKFKTFGDTSENVGKLLEVMPAYGSCFPTVESWGVFGLCWGGKVAILAATTENNPFSASGQTHPGLLAGEDAAALTTPHLCMPSKDEPADVVLEYEKILTEKKLGKVDHFPTMFHGWMGARANLSDHKNLAEYSRGYQIAAEFFANNL